MCSAGTPGTEGGNRFANSEGTTIFVKGFDKSWGELHVVCTAELLFALALAAAGPSSSCGQCTGGTAVLTSGFHRGAGPALPPPCRLPAFSQYSICPAGSPGLPHLAHRSGAFRCIGCYARASMPTTALSDWLS